MGAEGGTVADSQAGPSPAAAARRPATEPWPAPAGPTARATGGRRFAFDLTHPANVRFLTPLIDACRQRGHEVLVTSRDKDCTVALLQAARLPHHVLSRRRGRARLAGEFAGRLGRHIRMLQRFRPDRVFCMSNPVAALAARLVGSPATLFEDNETMPRVNRWSYRLATEMITPDSFPERYGPHHLTYPGCFPVGYAHPARFTPDPAVPRRYGLEPGRYVVVRRTAPDAIHDRGHHGLAGPSWDRLLQALARVIPLVVSSEAEGPAATGLPAAVRPAPPDLLDLLGLARLQVGDSVTVAYEAAVLGTPAVLVHSRSRATIDHLVARYRLVQWIPAGRALDAVPGIAALAGDPGLRQQVAPDHSRFVADCPDLAPRLVSRYLD